MCALRCFIAGNGGSREKAVSLNESMMYFLRTGTEDWLKGCGMCGRARREVEDCFGDISEPRYFGDVFEPEFDDCSVSDE